MENFRKLTVKQLQFKCREAGIPSTGTKTVLIERLKEKAENLYSRHGGMIVQLEKTIVDLCAMSALFQSSHYSTISHENSPVRITGTDKPQRQIQLPKMPTWL